MTGFVQISTFLPLCRKRLAYPQFIVLGVYNPVIVVYVLEIVQKTGVSGAGDVDNLNACVRLAARKPNGGFLSWLFEVVAMPQNKMLLLRSPKGYRAEFFVDACEWESAQLELRLGGAVQVSGYIRPAGTTVGGSVLCIEVLESLPAGAGLRAGIVDGQVMEALPGDELEIIQI